MIDCMNGSQWIQREAIVSRIPDDKEHEHGQVSYQEGWDPGRMQGKDGEVPVIHSGASNCW